MRIRSSLLAPPRRATASIAVPRRSPFGVSGRRLNTGLVALGIATACLASLSAQDTRGRAAASTETWDTFVADVTIRHRRLQPDGSPIGLAPPPIRYRWERRATAKGWTTIMTFASPAGKGDEALRPQNARYDVARIEDDGDGTPVRVYNRRGELMALPSPDALKLERGRHLLPEQAALAREAVGKLSAPTDTNWAESIVATPRGTDGRRRALQKRYGRHKGRIRGLGRFLKTEGDETEEMLVDSESALPVEVNVVRGGRLVWHSRLMYARDGRGAYVRRGMHVEQVVSDKGERLATDFELANVRFERRGRR